MEKVFLVIIILYSIATYAQTVVADTLSARQLNGVVVKDGKPQVKGGNRINAVVVDSITRIPLPNASVYDRHGVVIDMTDDNGVLPKLARNSYPITIHYLGFQEKTVMEECPDTIFLSENISELPEVVVESRRRRVLHVLAYVREYSTLTTYTDSVFLFREKMVDYMLP
ncbi:MAG: carboxypeptidase-like regulatory domain-containing protein, partial [Muribaculaceae bacterium]|nr:carboxypeptidase-like regulatory domain-containing protein [Muribaculaceae bacterium]